MSDDYFAERLPANLPANPMLWLDAWMSRARQQEVQPNPNAMTLATTDAKGRPSARIVLAKELDVERGVVVFFTNYRSRKGNEIDANPKVSLVFHWDTLGRQVRVEGIAVKAPHEVSDTYFASRDRGSQLGAWGSDQSQPIASREGLLEQLERRSAKVAGGNEPISRPPHWGGYLIWASAVELWINGANRVHDRARFERALSAAGDNAFGASPWTGTRLQP